jgi:hypothetical protein
MGSALSRIPLFLKDMTQKASTGTLHHAVDVLKTASPAVIGIGHLGAGASLGIELSQEVQRCISSEAVPETLDVLQVGPIHGHDVVEFPEILALKLLGRPGEGNPVAGRRPNGADIRRFSHMPASGSGRIHSDVVIQPFLPEEVVKDSLCHGRAADVTETDHENGDVVGHVERIRLE